MSSISLVSTSALWLVGRLTEGRWDTRTIPGCRHKKAVRRDLDQAIGIAYGVVLLSAIPEVRIFGIGIIGIGASKGSAAISDGHRELGSCGRGWVGDKEGVDGVG